MDTARIERDLKLLKAYALVMTVVVGVLSLGAFTRGGAPASVGSIQGTRAKFDEIDVERINVMEPDGKYRLVLSNRPRSIGPIYKGKPFGYAGGTRPGIIFFNDEGTENGGLTLTGSRNADGTYRASTHMSFDQFDQDQIVVLNYSDNNGDRQAGLAFSDRTTTPIIEFANKLDSIQKMPDGPAKAEAMARLRQPIQNGVVMNAQRVFIGRDRSKASLLRLSDPMGRPRLVLRVDSAGAPQLEFLDDSGRVTSRLPQGR